MLRQPNVVDGLDCFSADELVRLIAHALAVVTNDTSAAHIANLFASPRSGALRSGQPRDLCLPDRFEGFPRCDLSISPLCAMEMQQRGKLVHGKNFADSRRGLPRDPARFCLTTNASAWRRESTVRPAEKSPHDPDRKRELQFPVNSLPRSQRLEHLRLHMTVSLFMHCRLRGVSQRKFKRAAA